VASATLETLAVESDNRQARHDHPLALPGLQAMLALEIEQGRAAEERRRDSHVHPAHVA